MTNLNQTTNEGVSSDDVLRPELVTCVLTSQYVNYFDSSVSDTATIILVVFNVILSLVSSILNVLIIKAIWSTAKLQTPTFILLCNLALTDFLIGIIIGPLEIVYLTTRALQQYDAFCTTWKILVVLSYILCPASLYTITCISFDRYISLLMRMKYKSIVTKKKTFKLLVCLWAWAVIGASLIALLGKGPFLIMVSCVTFFCLIVITDCYIQSFAIIKERKLKNKSGRFSTTDECISLQTSSMREDRNECVLSKPHNNDDGDSHAAYKHSLVANATPKSKGAGFSSREETKDDRFRYLRANETATLTRNNTRQNASKPKHHGANKNVETIVMTTKPQQDLKVLSIYNLEKETLDRNTPNFYPTSNQDKTRVKRNPSKLVKGARRVSLPADFDKFSRTLYTIMIIVVILFLCFLPYLVVSTMVTLRMINIGITWDVGAAIVYMNSSISPVILCTRIPNVRKACFRVLKKYF